MEACENEPKRTVAVTGAFIVSAVALCLQAPRAVGFSRGHPDGSSGNLPLTANFMSW